jgi:KDO2-lipid IV(A) lauroyltransferase
VSGLGQFGQKTVAALAAALLAVIGALPPALLFVLTRFLAFVVFLLWRRRRQISIENLLASGLAANPAEARRLARASFLSFALMVAESLVVKFRMNGANWRDFVTLKLSPEVERLLAEPKQGLLIASAHLGNWEVAAKAVAQLKPMLVVYRPFNNPELDRVFHAGRTNDRLRLVSRNERNPMRFLNALAQGEMVALMIDQHVHDGRVRVDFLGRPAWTTKSVAMMHFTTRAPLIFAVAVRTAPLRFEVHAVGPVTTPRTGDRERDALEFTQALTREVERFVRQYPEQYMWGHRRWKEA